MLIQFIFISLYCLSLNSCSKTEYIISPCESVSIPYGLGDKPLSIGVYMFNDMKRTKFSKRKIIKRIGTQGRYSIYYKVWNEYHPNDIIIPRTGYVIHHIDENPNNNNPENLLKMTDSDHKRYHTSDGRHPNQGKKFSEELKRKLSESHLGQKAWNKGKTGIYSEETKRKMGAGNRGKPSVCGMLGKKHTEETKQKMRGKIPWNKGLKKNI